MLNTVVERGGPRVRLRWVPGHAKIEGNEKAHEQAKRITSEELPPAKMSALNTMITKARATITAPPGKWDVDAALPGKHVRSRYDGKPYKEAATLCQL